MAARAPRSGGCRARRRAARARRSTGTCSSPSACMSSSRSPSAAAAARSSAALSSACERRRGRRGTRSARARSPRASSSPVAGQIATTRRHVHARCRPSSAMKPPMLEPRSAIGPGGSSAAIVATSSSAPAAERAVALAVAALVEADRRHAGGAQRAREVEVVLLLRAGAVEHHDAAGAGAPARQEQRVGQPVAGAQLGRRLDVDGAHARGIMPRRDGRRRSSLSPRLSARQPRRPSAGHLELGGCDAVDARARVRHARLRRRRGRHPRRAPGPSSAPTRPAATTSRSTSPPRRSRAPRSCASCARRGWRATSPPAASCASRCKAGFDPARIHLHGNAKSEAELAEARGRGRRPRRRRQPHRHRPSRAASCPTARRQRVQLRVAPGVSPDTHPSISTGGPNTKFGFDLQSRAAPRSSASTPPTGSSSRACTCTSARRSTTLEPLPHRAGGDRRARPATGWSTSAAASASPTSAPSTRRRSRSTSPPRSTRCATSWAPACAILDEPGRALVANSTVTLYTVQSVKRNVDLYVAVDGGHVRQPAPDALRRALRGADRVALRRRDVLPPRRQALRVGRPHRPRRRARRPARGRRRRHPGHRRLRLRDGQHLQRRPARAGRLRQGRRRARWSCAARPTRTCWPGTSRMSERFRVGLLGHGTVGSAFAELLEARADADRGRSPACGPSCAAC